MRPPYLIVVFYVYGIILQRFWRVQRASRYLHVSTPGRVGFHSLGIDSPPGMNVLIGVRITLQCLATSTINLIHTSGNHIDEDNVSVTFLGQLSPGIYVWVAS